MKAIIIFFVSTALVCGCGCKTTFAQKQEKPFAVASVKVAELNVTGMTCQDCADHITGALSKKAGVLKSDVKFAENSASITYDPASVNEAEIIRTIEEAGYKAEIKGVASKEGVKKDPAPHACCVPKKKN
ncbi:MAG: heavy-metal-associated domain-containing protein [Cyclobacteriaceae bacterium]|nr:heavy-metal-associated domain-containing protein [Cyclobacteriaceae bacterium]